MKKLIFLLICVFFFCPGYGLSSGQQSLSLSEKKKSKKRSNEDWSFLFAKNESNEIADAIARKTSCEKKGTLFSLQEFGISTGYGKASIRNGPYEISPFILKWGLDLKPLFEKQEFWANNLLLLMVEPHIGFVYCPKKNAEIGINFLVKYGHFFTPVFVGFIEGGPGIIYITQHIREQETQCNFASQIGAGIRYLLGEKWAVDGEYRFRHVSNAGIKHPNRGIDSHIFLLGFSLFF